MLAEQSCHDLKKMQMAHILDSAWVRGLTLRIRLNIGLAVMTESRNTAFKSL